MFEFNLVTNGSLLVYSSQLIQKPKEERQILWLNNLAWAQPLALVQLNKSNKQDATAYVCF